MAESSSQDIAAKIAVRSLGRAATNINGRHGVGGPDEVTQMTHQRRIREANPPEPPSPQILTYGANAEKKRRDAESSSVIAFRPEWRIYDRDSISSSFALAAEWSKNGIPAADLVDIVHMNDMVDETELKGAHASFLFNAHFQSAIYQAKDFRERYNATKKENDRLEKEKKVLEVRTVAAEKEASELKLENQKLVISRSTAIDDYMGSDALMDFIDDHDDRIFPGIFTKGLDLNSVVAQHPGLFDPFVDFRSPYLVSVAITSGVHQEGFVGENKVIQREEPQVDDQRDEE
ncbi:uncharacterized protein LOC141717221 [Apium graveolens]|uniref:uncharacterized protein LOC141717221 n=1 Tax=Apium graveolens TaxID=4045 RepID=UPI003D7BC424